MKVYRKKYLTDDLTNYQSLEPVRLPNLLLDQAAPNFRKKEEHDATMGELDPTITFTIVDNPKLADHEKDSSGLSKLETGTYGSESQLLRPRVEMT